MTGVNPISGRHLLTITPRSWPEGPLLVPSQIQIDKPHTVTQGKIGAVAVNRALALFFGLV